MAIILYYWLELPWGSMVLASMLQQLPVVKEMDAVSLMHSTKEEFSAFHGYLPGLLSQRACIRLPCILFTRVLHVSPVNALDLRYTE